MKTQTRFLTRLLDAFLWLALAFYVFGGYRLHDGRVKLTYVNDVFFALAILFVAMRLGAGVKFGDTSFGRAWSIMWSGAFESARKRSLKPIARLPMTCILQFAAGAYLAFLFLLLPLVNHWALGTHAFDLGIIENAIWNGSRTGKFFTYYLIRGDQPTNYLPGNRLNLGLIPFALLYRVAPWTELLLLAQSLALLAALIPLYKLGDLLLPRAIPRWVPLVLYWLWDPIHRMNVWDFHETPFMIPLALWGFYFIERRKPWQAAAALVAMAAWREDAWWVMAGIALYAGIRTRQWKAFGPLAALGVVVFPIHAAFYNHVNTIGDRYSYLGNDFSSAIRIALARPWVFFQVAWQNAVFYKRLILSAGGGIFLASGWPLLTLILPVAEVSLSSHPAMLSWNSHYVGLFAGPLMYATLIGWARLHPWIAKRFGSSKARAAVAVSMAIALSQLAFSEPGGMTRAVQSYRDAACARGLVRLIPEDAPLLASDPLASQLSRRRYVSLPFRWVHLTQEEWRQVDQTDAEWLVGDQREFLNSGLTGKHPGRPWKIVSESCGLIVAKRAPAR